MRLAQVEDEGEVERRGEGGEGDKCELGRGKKARKKKREGRMAAGESEEPGQVDTTRAEERQCVEEMRRNWKPWVHRQHRTGLFSRASLDGPAG